MESFARPATLEQAVGLLAAGIDGGARHQILAGGTDVYPAQGDRPFAGPIMDISGVAGLRGIARTDEGWRIGAGTTWTDVVRADLPPAFRALQQAAREVGSVQIQNVATVAGNLCNASPAADGVPPLLVLDAEVELASVRGMRRMPLAEFITGNRSTMRGDDEMVTAVVVPEAASTGSSHFRKLGARKYLVISIAMVAARLDLAGDGTVRDAAIAVGACAPVARRLPDAEAALVGARADTDLPSRIGADHLAGLSPIDDVRGTGAYRSDAALELVRRCVTDCIAEPA